MARTQSGRVTFIPMTIDSNHKQDAIAKPQIRIQPPIGPYALDVQFGEDPYDVPWIFCKRTSHTFV